MEGTEAELRLRITRFIVELERCRQPQQAQCVAERLRLCMEAEEIREPPFKWSRQQVDAFKIGDTAIVFQGTEPPWYGQHLTLTRIQITPAGGTILHFFDQFSVEGKSKIVASVGRSRVDPRSVHSLDDDEAFDAEEA